MRYGGANSSTGTEEGGGSRWEHEEATQGGSWTCTLTWPVPVSMM